MSEIDTDGWKEFKLVDVVGIEMGSGLDFGKMRPSDEGVVFVGRTGSNNGSMGVVEEVSDVQPYPAGLMTVALGGSIGAAFVQSDPFYTSQNVAVVRFPDGVGDNAKRFVATAVQKESSLNYKAFVKELNKHLRKDFTIKLPATADGDPDWDWMAAEMERRLQDSEAALSALTSIVQREPEIVDTSQWGEFRVGDLFDVVKGSRLTSLERFEGDIPYVGASQFDNGVTQLIGNDEKLHPAGVLTVCYNGPVGTTFLQPREFWATDDVNVLYSKDEIGDAELLFIAPMIQRAGEEYAYIDKWKMSDMKATAIKLPVTPAGDPDWSMMESMMKQRIESAEEALKVLVS